MRFWKKQRTYQITPNRDEWVAPEDTLIDASSNLSNIEVPVSDAIWQLGYVATAGIALILLGGTAWLAITRHDELAQLVIRNRTVNVSVPPPRGIIMDRTGTPLVQNIPSFDLLVVSRQVQHSDNGTLPSIGIIAQTLERDSEELTLTINDMMRTNAAFFLATDMSREQVLSLSDSLPSGFYVITSTKRQYIDGSQFSHVLGYVGKVNRQDMARDPYYLVSDTIGRLGIESAYESVLRGIHGKLMFETQDTKHAPAQQGGNVVLQVDAPSQKILWKSVWDILRESGLTQAAAVAQDPRSGAVLGIVSFPAYDNNIFSGALDAEDAQRLFSSNNQSMVNRIISGLYNPGSTIKPFIGMTAIQEGVVTSTQVVTNDCINLTIPNPSDPDHPYVYSNWRTDFGPFTLNRAIANSCNIYFFTVGGGHGSISGLGVNRIVKYLRNGFADSLLGIDLPGEERGFLPTPEWKMDTKQEPWYQGDTYNISIGQGDLLVTPLWINSYISAIANGGTVWKPMVAQRIVDAQRNTISAFQPQALGTLPFAPGVIRNMQTAMRQTVTTGTASLLGDIGVPVAAKTGTAEVVKGRRINSLLTVYAPADNPSIALTVLIEGSAQNQGYALRVAHQFLSWYFSASRTPEPSPSPTESVAPTGL